MFPTIRWGTFLVLLIPALYAAPATAQDGAATLTPERRAILEYLRIGGSVALTAPHGAAPAASASSMPTDMPAAAPPAQPMAAAPPTDNDVIRRFQPVPMTGGYPVYQPPPAPYPPPSPPAYQLYPTAQTNVTETAPAPDERLGRYKKSPSLFSRDYLLSYPQNAWRILSSPFSFDRDDWITVVSIAGVTGLVMLADEEISDTWRDDIRSSSTDDLSDIFRVFGETEAILLGAAALYGSAAIFDLPQEREAGLLVAQSYLLSALLTEGLKRSIGRGRPENNQNDAFSFFESGSSNRSMPSGHATHAFAVAATLTEVYGEDAPWLRWVAYPTATLTALSRVNDDRHWASDVIVGGAIGYFIGKMVARYSPFRGETNISLLPFADRDGGGVKMLYRY
jgi:membrane-associated phospholipid phosphatase